jgi:hypothetical protein
MMSLCAFSLAVLFFLIGVVTMLSPDPAQQPLRAGATPTPLTPVSRMAGPIPNRTPAAMNSPLGGAPVNGTLQKLDWIKVNDRITVPHPVKGALTEHVLGRILFTELWQTASGPQNPWVPTGNSFAGFWLDGEMLLLNWQNRFYLLDEHAEVSDPEIQRDFLPHARKFAQSNQTADVYFAYPPASWHIDDIGKFTIASVEGAALNHRAGAAGRFIHASGDGGRALVLDDFESGAQDMVWTGYLLQEAQIQKT